MIVVSDTSCISNLYQIGQLNLLTKLFKEILITPFVFNELSIFHADNLLNELKSFNIKVHSISDSSITSKIAESGIDAGDAEAIALSLELKALFLIIDEKEGKKVAQQYGVNTIGILGVILLSKEKRLIEKARPVFDQLRNNTSFYFSNSLYMFLLKQAKEESND